MAAVVEVRCASIILTFTLIPIIESNLQKRSLLFEYCGCWIFGLHSWFSCSSFYCFLCYLATNKIQTSFLAIPEFNRRRRIFCIFLAHLQSNFTLQISHGKLLPIMFFSLLVQHDYVADGSVSKDKKRKRKKDKDSDAEEDPNVPIEPEKIENIKEHDSETIAEELKISRKDSVEISEEKKG